ncbi:MAG: hypothetical protein RBT65_00105 [Methanolobus sp.]|nr:hypothetical protein [Methanolobus sp.]
MKTNIRFGIGMMLAAMLLVNMAFVPAVSAVPEKTMEQWMQDHTVNVESTTTYKYEQGHLEIKETYTGKDLEERFGVNNITKVKKVPIDKTDIRMQEGTEKVVVVEKAVVLTTTAYHWWDYYDYPQWTWSNVAYTIYEKEDPINLVWNDNTVNTVKSEILNEGWTDYPVQFAQYVSDPQWSWVMADGVADNMLRLNGGYHARLWQTSYGDVVANAHHDSASPHHADQYEQAEDLVAGFYGIGWTVNKDNYWLNNKVTTPYNDGKATVIN